MNCKHRDGALKRSISLKYDLRDRVRSVGVCFSVVVCFLVSVISVSLSKMLLHATQRLSVVREGERVRHLEHSPITPRCVEGAVCIISDTVW